MDDLFDAIRQAIHDYTHMDEMTPRRQKGLRDVYSKFTYSPEVVDGLLTFDSEEGETSEEE